MMPYLNLPQRIIIWIPPVLLAIILHEVAHGLVAYWRGDPTAKMLGRLSLNPAKHLTPVGSAIVPALCYYFGGFVYGWAKPVPISPVNFKHPRLDDILVSVAGPAANLLMAVMWALLFKLLVSAAHLSTLFDVSILTNSVSVDPTRADAHMMTLALAGMCVAGMSINTVLCLFNLLPLPPLDGGHILMSVLPGKWSWQVSRIAPYVFYGLFILLAFGWLQHLLTPLISKGFFLLITGLSVPKIPLVGVLGLIR